jgi:hypothetical protein
LLSDFNQNLNVLVNFTETPRYQISRKVHLAAVVICRQTDGQTITAKVICTFSKLSVENMPQGIHIATSEAGQEN